MSPLHYPALMISSRARRALARQNGALRVLTYIVLLTSTAHAGHAPLVPEPRTLLIRDGEPDHVVIGTRRGGYFITRDAGATWSWMCEAAVGYDDEEVYPGAFLANGTLVVSTGFGGLAVSRDGCGWSPWLPREQPFVADIRVRRDLDNTVVALEGSRDNASAFVNQLWQSRDAAGTWQTLGPAFAPDTQALNLAISGDGVMYVATSGPSGAELLRSDDSALSWERALVTSEAGVVPRIIAVSGGDVSHVYLVLDAAQVEGLATPGDRIVMSLDAGRTFLSLLQGEGDLSASSLSADGKQLVVGGHDDGIYLLSDADQATAGATLELVSPLRAHALAWGADQRLYAAGHEAIDGFSVGVSADQGRSFSPFFALCQVVGPLSCPAGSSVGQLCSSSGETGWDVRKEVADSSVCTADDGTGTAGAPSSAAEGSAAATSSNGCGVAFQAQSGVAHWLFSLAALGALVKRRRSRYSLAGSSRCTNTPSCSSVSTSRSTPERV
jgi:hypothetical protein